MCLCGDIFCGSCGPAQGNHHCPHCGLWEADIEERWGVSGVYDDTAHVLIAVYTETGCFCSPEAQQRIFEAEQEQFEEWQRSQREEPYR